MHVFHTARLVYDLDDYIVDINIVIIWVSDFFVFFFREELQKLWGHYSLQTQESKQNLPQKRVKEKKEDLPKMHLLVQIGRLYVA